MVSESFSGDTRNNWLVFMFVSKHRRNVFRKQSTLNAFLSALQEATTRWGYGFREVGFGGTHVHFEVDVPSQYSVDSAIAFLKSFTARRIFAAKPNFRKLYHRGSFWSGYEHHYSFGKDAEASRAYVRSQAEHHHTSIIDDTQPVTLTGWIK
jgi:REP element-mobilizing transposase RayT